MKISRIFIETTFLQESYKRATIVRPKQGKRSDIDIVVVTKLDKEEVTPEEAPVQKQAVFTKREEPNVNLSGGRVA